MIEATRHGLEALSGRWGYALIVPGKGVVATWSLVGSPESDAALDEGTRRVLESGSDEAYWQTMGQVAG